MKTIISKNNHFIFFSTFHILDMWLYQKITYHMVLHLNIVIVANISWTKSAVNKENTSLPEFFLKMQKLILSCYSDYLNIVLSYREHNAWISYRLYSINWTYSRPGMSEPPHLNGNFILCKLSFYHYYSNSVIE